MRHAACVSRGVGAVLAVTALTATAACSGGSGASVVAAPTAPTTAAPLTDDQADTALIGASDLGSPWEQTDEDAAHDGLLEGTVDGGSKDCQQFLDRLEDGDLLGDKTSADASRVFYNNANESYLDYEVAAYKDQADAKKELDWLKTLPQICDQFTAKVGSDKTDATVQVVEFGLPDAAGDHIGLNTTLTTQVEGEDATLTLDSVAVLNGPNGITFTNGGLQGAERDATEQAAQLGSERLQQVMEGKSPAETPGELD
ncbi:hypothetical protein [Streptomyces jeddahensis]|uniref:Lipoprotein n=1 Tax=Streptomyces jeddahensis TaxID=1716141 RepID=A0A177HY33_9ACTN|nr:hypothetical protein [Streptomyces jeddahensis]OAH15499.1 hypothetical protein STSP_11010 [Streptomyces jeddahensis]